MIPLLLPTITTLILKHWQIDAKILHKFPYRLLLEAILGEYAYHLKPPGHPLSPGTFEDI